MREDSLEAVLLKVLRDQAQLTWHPVKDGPWAKVRPNEVRGYADLAGLDHPKQSFESALSVLGIEGFYREIDSTTGEIHMEKPTFRDRVCSDTVKRFRAEMVQAFPLGGTAAIWAADDEGPVAPCEPSVLSQSTSLIVQWDERRPRRSSHSLAAVDRSGQISVSRARKLACQSDLNCDRSIPRTGAS